MSKKNPDLELVEYLNGNERSRVYFDKKKSCVKLIHFREFPVYDRSVPARFDYGYDGFGERVDPPLFIKHIPSIVNGIRVRGNGKGYYFYNFQKAMGRGSKNIIRDVTHRFMDGRHVYADTTFSNVVHQKLGVTPYEAFMVTHPQLQFVDTGRDYGPERMIAPFIPKLLTEAMRMDDPKDAARHIFGDYSKEIMKAYASSMSVEGLCDLDLAMMGRHMGIHPTNLARMILTHRKNDEVLRYADNDVSHSPKKEVIRIAKLMGGFLSEKKKMKFLLQMGTEPMWLEDSLRMLRGVRSTRDYREIVAQSLHDSGDVREFHDNVMGRIHVPQPRNFLFSPGENIEFKFYSELENISAIEIDGMTVKFPKDSNELWNWGTMMNHCIGSYSYSINKTNFVFALMKGGKMVYNVDIRNNCDVIQCMASGNTPAPKEFVDKLQKKLDEATWNVRSSDGNNQNPSRANHDW